MRLGYMVYLILSVPACLLTSEIAAGQACFRGRPLPECRLFWITEAGVCYRLDSHDTDHWKNRKWHEKLLYSWELGLMVNRNKGHALGGSLFLDYDDFMDNTQIGVRVRYRRWISRLIRIDFAPGAILNGSAIQDEAFSGLVALNADDYVAVTLRLDVTAWDRSRTHGNDFAWYGGLKFCSYPGLVVGIAVPIIAVLVWASEFDMGRMDMSF